MQGKKHIVYVNASAAALHLTKQQHCFIWDLAVNYYTGGKTQFQLRGAFCHTVEHETDLKSFWICGKKNGFKVQFVSIINRNIYIFFNFMLTMMSFYTPSLSFHYDVGWRPYPMLNDQGKVTQNMPVHCLYVPVDTLKSVGLMCLPFY